MIMNDNLYRLVNVWRKYQSRLVSVPAENKIQKRNRNRHGGAIHGVRTIQSKSVVSCKSRLVSVMEREEKQYLGQLFLEINN